MPDADGGSAPPATDAPAGRRVLVTVEFIGNAELTGSEDIPELLDRAKHGDLSRRVLWTAADELDPGRLALLAVAHGTDPEFFGVDPFGAPTKPPSGSDSRDAVIDYSRPAELISLLEDRGCTIVDGAAVTAAVCGDPGPVYHDGWDIDETGHSWEQHGGPWADRLMAELSGCGAIVPPPPASAPTERSAARTSDGPSAEDIARSAIEGIEAVESGLSGEQSDRLSAAAEDVLLLLARVSPGAALGLENE